MKRIELSKATEPLRDYAKRAKNGPVIVTARGKPLAAVVSLEGVDRESLSLSTNPAFIAMIEESRIRHEREGGISSEEMRKRLGRPKRQRRRP
jgi:prevent-host-death family protein